jgi:putative oxygen-independent coproporphyrinogen III oxidase
LSEAFGIYVHWPFCKAKCPYCDFNSHVRHQAVDHMSFAQALVREIEFFQARTPGRVVSSIFFGGGTPSLMPPAAVALVLDAIAALWPVAANAEVTLEANPTSAEAENFRGYRAAGVNRVSVGVQSLHAGDLAALGRQHSPEEALACFRMAAEIFPRASFDMIYARPGQSLTDWHSELSEALSHQQGHMSLYQLTIEPETRYFDLHEAGKLVLPEDDLAADLYDLTQDLTAAHGLSCYEISNHAKAGQESQHNLLYWRYGEYAGVGPGAHSRLRDGDNRVAIAMEKHPETWRAAIAAAGHGIASEEVIVPAAQAREMLLMGLRVNEGISLSRFQSLAGEAIDGARIAALAELGFVQHDNDRLCATRAGRRVLNAVIAELI